MLGLFGEELGKESLLVANRPEKLIFVATVKRRLAQEHFVEQNPKRPPINAIIILQALDDLKVMTQLP